MRPHQGTPATGSLDELVPVGAFYFPVTDVRPTRHFSFLLLDGFTLLAFSSALDPLRIANQLAQRPLYRWDVFSEDGQSVCSSSGVEINVDGPLNDVSTSAHLIVCSGNLRSTAASETTLAWLRRHHRFGGRLGGLCTGAVTLARAGLLRDRAFTLHWENQPGFIESFPELAPTSRRYETDGNLLTCGGGSASVDLMLWVIAQDYGDEFAIMVSEMCLHAGGAEKLPGQRSSLATVINTRNRRILQVVREMQRNIEDPQPIEQLASGLGYSRRQIERQFRLLLDETPMKTYRNIRLDHARRLFTDTDMSVAEVATACGFVSSTHFSRCYRERFGTSPSAYRFKPRR